LLRIKVLTGVWAWNSKKRYAYREFFKRFIPVATEKAARYRRRSNLKDSVGQTQQKPFAELFFHSPLTLTKEEGDVEEKSVICCQMDEGRGLGRGAFGAGGICTGGWRHFHAGGNHRDSGKAGGESSENAFVDHGCHR
jgi:hypothetical protein